MRSLLFVLLVIRCCHGFAQTPFSIPDLPDVIPRSPGSYFCVPEGSDDNWPWYLRIGAGNYRYLDLLSNSDDSHLCRLWMQRYWLERPEPKARNYFRFSNLSVGKYSGRDYFLQFDYLGYAMEGHAVISLYQAVQDSEIAVDYSFGFFNENTLTTESVSFGPVLSVPIRIARFVNVTNEIVPRHLVGPSQESLEVYRRDLVPVFGTVGESLAKRIILSERGKTLAFKLTKVDYHRKRSFQDVIAAGHR